MCHVALFVKKGEKEKKRRERKMSWPVATNYKLGHSNK